MDGGVEPAAEVERILVGVAAGDTLAVDDLGVGAARVSEDLFGQSPASYVQTKVTGRSAKTMLSTASCRAQSRTCASCASAHGGSPIRCPLSPRAVCSAAQRANLSRVRAEVS